MSLENALATLAQSIDAVSAALTASAAPPLPVNKATVERDVPPAAPTKPTKPTKAAPIKAALRELAPKVPASAKEPEGEPEVTLAQVSEVIGELLQADQRDAAVSLLGEFGAKNASGLKESDYGAFHTRAREILELAA